MGESESYPPSEKRPKIIYHKVFGDPRPFLKKGSWQPGGTLPMYEEFV